MPEARLQAGRQREEKFPLAGLEQDAQAQALYHLEERGRHEKRAGATRDGRNPADGFSAA